MRPDALRSRVRLGAACVLLVGLAMAQSPGLLVADTKLDLATGPAGFLARATHLWDPVAAAGQLQNQAYGYLFPMGQFFLLGSLADVPGWAVQRLWLALVMCVAFLGVVRLARAFGLRSDLALVLCGFAYALSPRMLTTLGPISVEAWPGALAPWVLVPLVVGSEKGSARRAAALSALAVALVGGVNAAAAFAVIPLGALWLLTRSPGPRRRSLMVWWPAFTLLGTLWWLVPLLVLGSYSPPFLDWIESASNTTFSTTLFDTLRGTSDWVPYVDPGSRAGNDLIRLFYLPIDSGVVLLLGLVGLLHRRNPHRGFLSLGVLLGMLMVSAGHLGSVQGWGAVGVQDLLDGMLAPLRNVHKFDPVLRLPLVLGLGWVVDDAANRLSALRAGGRDLDEQARRLRLRAVLGTAALAVLGTSLPALTGHLTPAGGLVAVPDYWKQTAGWLAARSDQGQALLVPGSSFGDYAWGSPHDEPMQSMAGSRWSIRNAVPLVPAGNVRMLDGIEARLAQGRGSSGLAAYLRRAGVEYLVVRNDLARLPDIPDPVLVHQALAGSPGLERVASFGPEVGGDANLTRRGERILVNGGWQSSYPAVEVYRVPGRSSFAVQSERPATVVGGPEDLLDLADLGVLDDRPTVLAADVRRRDPASPLVLTDGLRAVERNFGRVHDGASATLVGGQRRRLANTARDYLLPDADRWSTWAVQEGAAVSASSSASDATAVGTTQPGQLPYAAVDGRADTFWRANLRTDEPAWWQLRLDRPRALRSVQLTAGPDGRQVVRVRTDTALTEPVVIEAGGSRTVALDGAPTRTLRVEDDSGRVANRTELAEVAVSGVTVTRRLRLPAVPSAWGNPDAIVLRAVGDARQGCARVRGNIRCVTGRAVAPEEDAGFARSLELPRAAPYAMRMEVGLRPGDALARRVFRDQPVSVVASSTGTPDARGSVLAAVDGDARTTWTAEPDDARPSLALNWIDKRTITRLQVATDADTAAREPRRVTLTWPGGSRAVNLDRDGAARFPAIRTTQLTVRVDAAERASSLGFDSARSSVPIGITELRLDGLPYLPIAVPSDPLRFPCGAGPSLVVDDAPVRTAVEASLADLYDGDTARAIPCGDDHVSLGSGTNLVEARASGLFRPAAVVLTDDQPLAAAPRTLVATRKDAVHRTLDPRAGGGVVVLRENTNRGWVAQQAGRTLDPVVVDGWQQGWRVPASTRPVRVAYRPEGIYRTGLGVGLMCLLVLLTGVAMRRLPLWRDDPGPGLHGRELPAPVRVAAGLLAGGLLAGWIGLAIASVTVVLGSLIQRRAPEAGPWLLAAVVLPSAVAYAFRPWGGASGWAGSLAWPHYLVVVVVVALFAWPADRSLPGPRSFSRSAGRSTSR